jgi:hypothetical protein
MLLRALIALGLSLSLCGCMAFESRAVRNSGPYHAGYSDGCAAGGGGNASVRFEDAQDNAANRKDKRYRSGYSAGFAACRSSPAGAPMLERGPIADPYPGIPR